MEQLKRRGRLSPGMLSRKRFTFIAFRHLGFPVAAIGKFAGVSDPAVSWLSREGERLVTEKEIRYFNNLTPG